MAADSELVEHVDPGGEVLDVVTRADVRRLRLRHRCTYVAVVTSDHRLVVHRRADWKDVFPGYWDVCFGGVCGVGESWLESATRELREESGLTGQLEDLGPISYEGPGPTGPILGRLFLLRSDAAPVASDDEVAELASVRLEDLVKWMAGRSVCADSLEGVVPLITARFGIEPYQS